MALHYARLAHVDVAAPTGGRAPWTSSRWSRSCQRDYAQGQAGIGVLRRPRERSVDVGAMKTEKAIRDRVRQLLSRRQGYLNTLPLAPQVGVLERAIIELLWVLGDVKNVDEGNEAVAKLQRARSRTGHSDLVGMTVRAVKTNGSRVVLELASRDGSAEMHVTHPDSSGGLTVTRWGRT